MQLYNVSYKNMALVDIQPFTEIPRFLMALSLGDHTFSCRQELISRDVL